MTSAPVALLLVSHSRDLANGLRDLVAQMAPGVLILAVGGLADGSLGTDFDAVTQAVDEAAGAAQGVAVLTDLGSATLTVDTVLELAEPAVARRVRLADAPFVEGAVAAGVAAHSGADLDTVVHAVHEATRAVAQPATVAEAGPRASGAQPAPVRAVLRNPLGLHARPAAVLSRLVAGFDAQVTIDGVNAASVIALMRLGATGGHELEVRAAGSQAAQATAAVVAAIEGGFGEA
ncbi:MAG: dihydroxyacetone kinase phosphoryl donor subunit DhaM [Cellulomonadaceae bacterium]